MFDEQKENTMSLTATTVHFRFLGCQALIVAQGASIGHRTKCPCRVDGVVIGGYGDKNASFIAFWKKKILERRIIASMAKNSVKPDGYLKTEFIRNQGKGETKMKPNTLRTNAASSNGTSAGSLAGKHRQAFTLVDRRPWLQRIRGFTLIELLVVIAIISMLLGLFATDFGGIKDQATYVECSANLKNLFLALQMYADDNDGQCPNPNVTDQIQVSKQIQISLKFKEALQPYVKSEDIFWCPNDREKEAHPGGSYGWRVTRDPKTSLAGVRLGLLRHPNRVMIAGELSHGCHKSEMINALYADGRVDLVTMGEFLENIRTPLDF